MSATTSKFSQQDQFFMLRAIALAKKGHYTTSPNPRVGCVIVSNGNIVGEGYHQKAGSDHAEVNALKQAQATGESIQGATAYVTLEPCSHFGRTPPCAEGLIKAGIKRVIAAMVDPNPKVAGNGLKLLEHAGISTQVGLCEIEARALNIGFIYGMEKQHPFVRCKLAASLDGKTAMSNGESQWITSSESRRDVQKLRAQSCAIITGADSLLYDNAKMTVRWNDLGTLKDDYLESDVRQPVRVVIDSRNRLTPELIFFKEVSPIIIIRNAVDKSHEWPVHVEQICVPLAETHIDDKCPAEDHKRKIDLQSVLTLLAERGCNDVLVESGAQLAGAFIEQSLVNELILYQAPKLMGAEAKSLANMPTITQLSDAKQLDIKDIQRIGVDIKITATFNI